MLTLEQFELWAKRIGALGVLGEWLMVVHGVWHAWRRPKGRIVGHAYERLEQDAAQELDHNPRYIGWRTKANGPHVTSRWCAKRTAPTSVETLYILPQGHAAPDD